MSKKAGCNASWKDWYRQTRNILEQSAVIEILTQVAPAAPENKEYILLIKEMEPTEVLRPWEESLLNKQ